MLKLENVTKLYPNGKGIKEISFQIKPGEILGVIGTNGSGKTTLFKSILTLKELDIGTISFKKKDIKELEKKQFGYLPEERSIYQDIKVYEQIEYIGKLKGMELSKIQDEEEYWLKKLNISEYTNSKIKDLSKGNQQKVQMICAFLHNPDIIILDEPMTGLDVVNAELFKEIILGFAKKKKTILVSSHQFDHIEGFFDKVLILKNGEVQYFGDVNKLKRSSKKRYIRFYCEKPKEFYLEDGVIHQEVSGKEITLLMENEEKARILFQKLLEEEPLLSMRIELPTLKDIIQERELI